MIAPGKNAKTKTLLTIGYEGLDLADFLEYLTDHEVDVLVDVRELAFSRKRGFSKTALREAVESKGVRYVHLRELGSPRDVRRGLQSNWDYDAFFGAYRKHLRRQTGAVTALFGILADNFRVCLMCFEKDHEKCHRSLLASFVSETYDGDLDVEPVQTWVK